MFVSARRLPHQFATWLLAGCCTLLALAFGANASDDSHNPPETSNDSANASGDGVDYARDIKPIFAEKCAACHGPLKQESALRLDAGKFIHAGGDSGPAIVRGNADESFLFRRATATEAYNRMPPEGEGEPLTAEQTSLLKEWINAGAEFPANEAFVENPRNHWAYQLPRRVPVPAVGPSHPIDALISQKLKQRNLVPAPRADRATLLRRVYFDLIGLPPTAEELAAFRDAFRKDDDESPEAWNEIVDDLLARPQFGERWGRHWMDVWRYSDWDGYQQELRGSQRHIWRWRDWIVASLNADKGYDRMILEMLAADELAPGDADILPATGFLARNYHNSNRNIWLDATVEHTAKAFLGLTLNCARCHDHKFDPIPQTDYYAFRAIFEPHNVRTDRVPGQPDLAKDGLPRAYDAEPDAATYLFLRGDEKHPDEEHPLSAAVPAVLGESTFAVEPIDLPPLSYYPALREHVVAEELARLKSRLSAAKGAFEFAETNAAAFRNESIEDNPQLEILQQKAHIADLQLRSYQARLAADRAKYLSEESACDDPEKEQLAKTAAEAERALKVAQAELVVSERTGHLTAAEQSAEADAEKKKIAINAARNALTAAEQELAAAEEEARKDDGAYTPLGKEYPRNSTGRRLALARWIASPANPLTARVAVNHIWTRHFGRPLVENVFDFGLRSPRPEHAELLDWLAVEFMESGWSMKRIHRLILTSETWRRSSSVDEHVAAGNLAIDPDNRLFWKANARRLDAEIVRDNLLAVAGNLDATLGGPDIDFTQGETSRRRSIYLSHAYEKQNRMLVLFDAASPNECYRRSESIIPQQALALANSSLSLTQSRILARDLWETLAEDLQASSEARPSQEEALEKFIRVAFVRVLGRSATSAERKACLRFLAKQTELLANPDELTSFVGGAEPAVPPSDDPQARARENLIHVLFSHNDFITVR